MSIYVCSDLHGQYRKFKSLLRKIKFSDSDTMYILGDIIDRGPNSIKLLQYIMSKSNIHCIMGNHEHMMYKFYTDPESHIGKCWIIDKNGGKKTSKDFDKLSNIDRQEILSYIENMYLQKEIVENNITFLLSHSCFKCENQDIKFNEESDEYVVNKILWNSPWRFWEYSSLDYYKYDGRVHIIGHVPVQVARYSDYNSSKSENERINNSNILKPIIEKDYNTINIDGGCALKYSMPDFYNIGIICLNITKFSYDDYNCYTYINL